MSIEDTSTNELRFKITGICKEKRPNGKTHITAFEQESGARIQVAIEYPMANDRQFVREKMIEEYQSIMKGLEALNKPEIKEGDII